MPEQPESCESSSYTQASELDTQSYSDYEEFQSEESITTSSFDVQINWAKVDPATYTDDDLAKMGVTRKEADELRKEALQKLEEEQLEQQKLLSCEPEITEEKLETSSVVADSPCAQRNVNCTPAKQVDYETLSKKSESSYDLEYYSDEL